MNILAGLLFLIGCFFSSTVFAQTGGCPSRRGNPSVNVQYVDVGVVYNYDLSAPQMQAIMSKSSVVTQDMMATALNGLTVARLSMNVNTQNNSLTTQNLVCIYPYAVNVQIGYTVPQVVYIKNKYQDGTCQKNAILQHENGHVLINKNTAKALTVAIKQDIENLVNDPGYPFPVANKETGNELITALIQQHIDADWAQSRALNANLNGQLDTPENYRATTRLCPNW